MARRSISVSVITKGLDRLMRDLAPEIDKETEKAAMKGANKAAGLAPRKTGALANSIPASVKKEKDGQWGYGTTGRPREYALVQEYEHRSKKGFYRRSARLVRKEYPKAIENLIKQRAR